jgi:hypothetical protein
MANEFFLFFFLKFETLWASLSATPQQGGNPPEADLRPR